MIVTAFDRRALCRCLAVFAVIAIAGIGSVAAEPMSASLVVVEHGNLPIIVTAPHGGHIALPGVAKRTGRGAEKLVTTRDTHTDMLAQDLAAELNRRLHGRVHLVIEQVDRKFLDVNRRREDAYESPQARPYFDAYHATVKAACDEVRRDWGHGLLLDIHGQGADESAVFRGTNNGKSVTHLVDRFGKTALTGPQSILGGLERAGYRIIPRNGSSDREDGRFNGGHTVQTYGSHQSTAIDAIQLEFGGDFRKRERLARTAADVAAAVDAFAHQYLPKQRRAAAVPARN